MNLEQLVNEARDGIKTLSDFYKPEILNYFWVDAVYDLSISLFFLAIGLVLLGYIYRNYKTRGLCLDDMLDELHVGDTPTIVIGLVSLIGGIVGSILSVKSVLMLYFAPKIYITREIINLL